MCPTIVRYRSNRACRLLRHTPAAATAIFVYLFFLLLFLRQVIWILFLSFFFLLAWFDFVLDFWNLFLVLGVLDIFWRYCSGLNFLGFAFRDVHLIYILWIWSMNDLFVAMYLLPRSKLIILFRRMLLPMLGWSFLIDSITSIISPIVHLVVWVIIASSRATVFKMVAH